jgi:hypothetical protein
MRHFRITIPEQLRNNAVAIISLLIALFGLGYNTWRNELSEQNRNVRQAGFQLLMSLSELQKLVFLAHYDSGHPAANPRIGWSQVLSIQDFSVFMNDDVASSANALRSAWSASWSGLGADDADRENLYSAIDKLRLHVRYQLEALE